jgi:lipoprotein-anchoring transpeptidase ErfK/SrfK
MLGRWLGVVLAVPSVVVVGLLGGSLLASGGGSGAAVVAGRAADRADATAPPGGGPSHARRAPTSASAPGSVVANARARRVLVYRTPGARHQWRRYGNPTPQRTPLVFLVRARRGAWLRVLLPSRPNGSEGWVRAASVELRADPYSLLVDLKLRRLIVHRAGRTLLDVPVGVGKAATPTPAGLYYVAELLRQPDPNGLYGPWAFALSAHSSVLSHFGGGDGQVGIHGTDDPAGIGHTVSHGCIRARNRVIRRLAAMLPLGTPVRIVARAPRRVPARAPRRVAARAPRRVPARVAHRVPARAPEAILARAPRQFTRT